jgi:putative phage-type endonuclease
MEIQPMMELDKLKKPVEGSGFKIQSHVYQDEKEWKVGRALDVTSTEMPALFGISPWMTPFELWHRKHDKLLVEIEENERMKWGKRLQNSIAEGIAEDRQWKVKHLGFMYNRIDQLRVGASFDSEASFTEEGKKRHVLLEVKNVDGLAFKDGWVINDDESVEAPLHIEMQVQTQLLVSHYEEAYICALVGGNHPVIIRRVRDAEIQKAIIEKVVEFWRSVDEGREPSPDFQKDYEFIKQLFNKAQVGKIIKPEEEDDWMKLVDKYSQVAKSLKELEIEKEAVKAELLMKVEDAEKVQGKGFSISAGIVKGGPVSYTRSDYRDFKIYRKKEGKK